MRWIINRLAELRERNEKEESNRSKNNNALRRRDVLHSAAGVTLLGAAAGNTTASQFNRKSSMESGTVQTNDPVAEFFDQKELKSSTDNIRLNSNRLPFHISLWDLSINIL